VEPENLIVLLVRLCDGVDLDRLSQIETGSVGVRCLESLVEDQIEDAVDILLARKGNPYINEAQITLELAILGPTGI
jgi:hypothetical protein